MFNLFQPSFEHLRDVSVSAAVRDLATAKILVSKGICTEDEYLAAINIATAEMDQIAAREREKALAEMSDSERKTYDFFQKLFEKKA